MQAGVKIADVNDSILYETGIDGFFRLNLDNSDSLIKIYSIGYGETIIKHVLRSANSTNLGNIPIFDYYTTGGTYEIGNKKNIFGKLKRKQPIIHYDLVVYEPIKKDSTFIWDSGSLKFLINKKASQYIIDLSLSKNLH